MTHLPCLFQREAAIWEMEEKQLHERHQLAKRQLKDMFFLQRHQMLVSEAMWLLVQLNPYRTLVPILVSAKTHVVVFNYFLH